MKIGGLQRVSLIDYPGEICAIVFTAGCNFRCPYCHNPELVHINGEYIAENKVFEFLKKRRDKLSAVSITGGEPTLHNDLPVFLEHIKSMGYKIKLDTNGTNPDILAQLIDDQTVDYAAMDVKAPLYKYDKAAGVKVDTGRISESINIIKRSGIDYEFRTTIVRSQLAEDDIMSIAKLIKGANLYYLQRFIPYKTLNPSFLNELPYENEDLLRMSKIIMKDYVHNCYVR